MIELVNPKLLWEFVVNTSHTQLVIRGYRERCGPPSHCLHTHLRIYTSVPTAFFEYAGENIIEVVYDARQQTAPQLRPVESKVEVLVFDFGFESPDCLADDLEGWRSLSGCWTIDNPVVLVDGLGNKGRFLKGVPLHFLFHLTRIGVHLQNELERCGSEQCDQVKGIESIMMRLEALLEQKLETIRTIFVL